jgi:hypothetical protein
VVFEDDRSYTVTFTDGPLGFAFRTAPNGAFVVEYVYGQAITHGVKPHSTITAINGEPVERIPQPEAAAPAGGGGAGKPGGGLLTIESEIRPLSVTFTEASNLGGDSVGESSGPAAPTLASSSAINFTEPGDLWFTIERRPLDRTQQVRGGPSRWSLYLAFRRALRPL